jgi:hypothetical protein
MRGVMSHQRTEITVVSDPDLATHGNGLPFAALEHRARNNRGGIAISKICL